MTSSNFGTICRIKDKTNRKKLVYSLAYDSMKKGSKIAAMAHGNKFEEIARLSY